ncbi:MAG: peptidylprolyl isomerase [Chloroflexota bacterium]
MAKRKHTAQRSHITSSGQRPRPGFTRRDQMLPPSSRRSNTVWLWLGGAAVVVGGLVVLAFAMGWIGKPAASPSPSPSSASSPLPSFANLHPPVSTPLASPPAAPAGDGTTATLVFPDGTITIELYTDSSPVAAENFINLAEAGYYDGILIHRVVPNFVVQMGDPTCRIENPTVCTQGQGGPGYGITDEPVVGTYGRGIVAMARSELPDSQGSQFFLILNDSARTALEDKRTYAIFGKVTEGLDVLDTLGGLPSTGGNEGRVLTNYAITSVTINRP